MRDTQADGRQRVEGRGTSKSQPLPGERPSPHGFHPFRFHDMRHWFAVDYLRRGGSIYTLQQILGHASLTTTEIYLRHLTPDEAMKAKRTA